jgi:hypothetical protein
MGVGGWQSPIDRSNHHEWRTASEELHEPDAGDGRRTAYAFAGFDSGGLCLGARSSRRGMPRRWVTKDAAYAMSVEAKAVSDFRREGLDDPSASTRGAFTIGLIGAGSTRRACLLDPKRLITHRFKHDIILEAYETFGDQCSQSHH